MWNYGYISEVDYIHGYFSELSPARMKLALLSRGIAHSVGRSPSYLELGFGQGLTLNIHAATNSGHFYGTDFNPSQVANAAELAAAVGKQVTIWEDSFEDLAARGDLPQFDIVALHGIWSWVSDETRAAIQSIARHYLKPGGILYVSHNILPGWSPMMPLRHLLDEYSRRAARGDGRHPVARGSVAGLRGKADECGRVLFQGEPGCRGPVEGDAQTGPQLCFA